MKFMFAEAWWLFLLPVLAVGGWFLWKHILKKAVARIALFVTARLATEAMSPHLRKIKRAQFIVRASVLALLLVALARPMTDPSSGEAERKGVDFVLLLDISKSMQCEDIEPSRLDAVKTAIGDWLRTLNGDRIGLVVFAGEAFVQAPLTVDYGALDSVLHEATPKAMSVGGSNIVKGIEAASQMLAKNEIDPKVIILISDGGSQDGDPIAAARKAKADDKVTILTVGVGTLQGAKVPNDSAWRLREEAKKKNNPALARNQFVRDEYGMEVTSRLDDRTLKLIASATGGKYYEFKPDGKTFETLRQQSLVSLPQKTKKLNLSELVDWFQLPLFLAIVLMLAEAAIPTLMRKRSAPQQAGVAVIQPANLSDLGGTQQSMDSVTTGATRLVTGRKPKVRATTTASLIAAGLLLAGTIGAQAGTPVGLEDIERLISSGKSAEAVQIMRDRTKTNVEDIELFYNLGMTLYRAQKFTEAVEVFQALQSSTNDPAMITRAELQIGNAQYHMATQLTKSGPITGAALAMERAYDSYDTIARGAGGKEAEHNLKVAAAELQELLMKVGDDRMAAAQKLADKPPAQEERALREALQAYERITEIEPKNEAAKKKAEDVKKKLAENLTRQADALAKTADMLEEKGPETDPAKKKPGDPVVEMRRNAVAKLEDALTQTPEDKKLDGAKQEQLKKISDRLTAQAEKEMAEPMAKNALNMKDQATLEEARTKLDAALAASPENKKAADLQKAASEKLEKSLVDTGKNKMETSEKAEANKEAQRAFDAMAAAAQDFDKALAINPENKDAQEGKQKADNKLPDLQAAAGKAGLEEAKKMMAKGGTPPPPPPSGNGGTPPPPPPSGLSSGEMQAAINTLEKAAQNFDSAIAARPDNTDFKAGLAETRGLLEQTRGQLDAAKSAQAAAQQQQQGEGEPTGQESAQPGEQNGPPMAMKTMTQLRGGRQKPTTGDHFWKKVRDW